MRMTLNKRYFFSPLLFLSLIFSHCHTATSNRLDSDNYTTATARVAILEKEIIAYSPIGDAAFELFNVNGFSNSRTTVPGASSWDYKFVVKVASTDVDKWLDGWVEIEATDYNTDWTDAIVANQSTDWDVSTTPKYYTRGDEDTVMLVYSIEGIIFKHITQN